MKLVSSVQMRKIDSEAINILGIPGIVLMENAAIKVYRHMAGLVRKGKDEVCIVCGKGNNGGDGFALARHLYTGGIKPYVFLIGGEEGLKGDALVNFTIIKNMKLDIVCIEGQEKLHILKDCMARCAIVVDALLGTGARGNVEGLYRDTILAINSSAHNVVSVDIPSGIDADTGKVLGVGVRADSTVTFALPKIGLFTYPGAEYTGRVIVEDITIPRELIESQNISINLVESNTIAKHFPKRRKDSNKGTYGRAYIIGGSKGMMGAVAMCGRAALVSGAGIVEMGVPMSIQHQVAPLAMEAIVRGLDDDDGRLSINSLHTITEGLKKSSSFAIGPGLSKDANLLKLMCSIIECAQIPGVIDADGLNLLAEDRDILYSAGNTMVITPHPGEMARLTGRDVASVQEDRIGYAVEFSTKYRVVTVLKGANTVIASPDGEVFINTTGNPGMAKGGSGDVLTGIIVSLLAQGYEPIDAAKCGVYIHGLAGDLCAFNKGEYGMKAGDIIDYIPCAIKEAAGNGENRLPPSVP